MYANNNHNLKQISELYFKNPAIDVSIVWVSNIPLFTGL